MAFSQAVTAQFKQDILNGVHQPGDVYKIALYTQAAALDKNWDATSYNTIGELDSEGGYERGGKVLTGRTVGPQGRGSYLDFDDPVWPLASFTADAAVIYNSSRSNKAVAVMSFDSATSTNAPFTVQLPAPGKNAVIAIP